MIRRLLILIAVLLSMAFLGGCVYYDPYVYPSGYPSYYDSSYYYPYYGYPYYDGPYLYGWPFVSGNVWFGGHGGHFGGGRGGHFSGMHGGHIGGGRGGGGHGGGHFR